MTCPHCEYHKNRAARWRAEVYKLVGHEIELPWVGLTDKEIQDSSWQHFVTNQWPVVHMVVRKLEAKLKEKNT